MHRSDFVNITLKCPFYPQLVTKYIYWTKVLPEQRELLQIFRTHAIFRIYLKMHYDQAIIHLSKSLNVILIKCLQITPFVNDLEVPTQSVRIQKEALLIINVSNF